MIYTVWWTQSAEPLLGWPMRWWRAGCIERVAKRALAATIAILFRMEQAMGGSQLQCHEVAFVPKAFKLYVYISSDSIYEAWVFQVPEEAWDAPVLIIRKFDEIRFCRSADVFHQKMRFPWTWDSFHGWQVSSWAYEKWKPRLKVINISSKSISDQCHISCQLLFC